MSGLVSNFGSNRMLDVCVQLNHLIVGYNLSVWILFQLKVIQIHSLHFIVLIHTTSILYNFLLQFYTTNWIKRFCIDMNASDGRPNRHIPSGVAVVFFSFHLRQQIIICQVFYLSVWILLQLRVIQIHSLHFIIQIHTTILLCKFMLPFYATNLIKRFCIDTNN